MEPWKIKHEEVIREVLSYINNKTDDFILKGGTALRQCYGLDRFSEDIDLDSTNKNIEKYIKEFCEISGYTYNKKKDTDTVKRFMINYGNDSKSLKVEISYRKKSLDNCFRNNINGIEVYDIDTLSFMKAAAYAGRDRIRDMYDIVFICNNYLNELSDNAKTALQEVLINKGIEQYDYLIREDQDPIIDKDKLLEDFLRAWDKIGLESEHQEISKNIQKEDPVQNIINNAKDTFSKLYPNKNNKTQDFFKHKGR